jgi:hypothetical protein
MTTITGFRLRDTKRNPFHEWHALLEEWPLVIDRFARVTEGDAPYWYTERTNCGVIAAAAWRAGMVALEEYQVKKTAASETAAPKMSHATRNGRCDLWIGSDTASLAIEAKHKWRDLSSVKLIPLSLDVLKLAVSNAKETKGDSKDPTAGIAFIPLYIKRKKAPTETELTEILNKIAVTFETSSSLARTDLVAWCFPHAMRGHTDEKTKNALPGILMLGEAA